VKVKASGFPVLSFTFTVSPSHFSLSALFVSRRYRLAQALPSSFRRVHRATGAAMRAERVAGPCQRLKSFSENFSTAPVVFTGFAGIPPFNPLI